MITFFVFSFSPQLYANKDEVFNDGKTIKDLRENINNLDKIENDLELKTKEFLKDNNIDNYIKKWISKVQYQELTDIILDYINKNSELEKKAKSLKKEDELLKMQEDFISLKKDLYKSLVAYIEPKSYKNYLVYVENNIKNFIEKNNLQADKLKVKNIYTKKVNVLEKKIQENKKILDLEVKNLIEQKLEERLAQLIDSSAFSKLTNQEKISTLEKIIDNLKWKINYFEMNLNYNSIYIEADRKKLEIYNMVIKKLKEVTYSLK